jgi:hypothetical protein
MTGIVIIWIVLSIIFATLGRNRKIGFTYSLLGCLMFSPLIGLIGILASEKHSEALMKLKIAHDSGSLTDEEYEKKVRKIVPNSEDKQNMWIGYAVVAGVILIIYLIVKIF